MAKQTQLTPGLKKVVQSMHDARERRQCMLEMRRSGKSVQEVADEFKMTRQRASVLLKRAEEEGRVSRGARAGK